MCQEFKVSHSKFRMQMLFWFVILLISMTVVSGMQVAAEPSVENAVHAGGDPTSVIHLPMVIRCVGSYVDDFSDPNSGWPIDSDQAVSVGYVGGEYRITVAEPGWVIAVTASDRLEDSGQVEIDMRAVNSVFTAGLMFGLNNDFTQFYTFELFPDGQLWQVWRFNANTGYSLLDEGISGAIKTGGATNHLAVVNEGTTLRLTVNGQTLHTRSMTNGRVGISTFSYDANVDVRFDNYTLLPLGCGPVTTTVTTQETKITAHQHERWLPERMNPDAR